MMELYLDVLERITVGIIYITYVPISENLLQSLHFNLFLIYMELNYDFDNLNIQLLKPAYKITLLCKLFNH